MAPASETLHLIVEVDAHGRVISFNEATRCLLGGGSVDNEDVARLLPRDCASLVAHCLQEEGETAYRVVHINSHDLLWLFLPVGARDRLHVHGFAAAVGVDRETGGEQWVRVLSAVGDGIDIINADHEIEFQNEVLNRRFGDRRGEKCFRVYYGRDEPCEVCPMARAIRTGEVQRVEKVTAGGSIHDITTSPFTDVDGRVKVIEVGRDVTDRTEATRALHESEERYRALAEQSLVAIGIVQDGRILYANPRTAEMLGYTNEEILEIGIERLIHPEDREMARDRLMRRLAGEDGVPPRYEFRLLTKDGEARWVDYHAVCFEYRGRPAIMTHALDITDRKRAEEALREAETRYRDLYENATDIIYTHDLDWSLTAVNATAERVLGWLRKEAIGRNLRDLIHPDSLPVADRALEEKLRHPDRSSSPYEIQIYNAKGGLQWLEVNSRLVFGTNGPVGVTGIARDISERKRLEAQLRQAQKMEVLGQLAGGVAHDFNNLLTGILGYTRLLVKRVEGDEKAEESLAQIERAAQRASTLTRQLLAFSRHQQLSSAYIDLNRAVVDFIKLLARTVGEHIELKTDLAPDISTVYADPAQIEQVVLNLAVNARDAMPDGGTLTISTHNANLDAQFAASHPWARPGRFVVLSVADTGVGMNAHTRERVFEPFFTTKPSEKGTGLGLAIVYGIVKQHEGLIRLESEPDKGTRFHLYFPATERGTEAAVESNDRPAVGGDETILLAEDEPIVRELAVEVLTDAGYNVIAVANGEEALETLRASPDRFDLAVLDVVMPKKGGAEVWSESRSLPSHVQVLLTSGYSPESLDVRVGTPDGPGFLAKPFTPQALLRKVRELLDANQPGKAVGKT